MIEKTDGLWGNIERALVLLGVRTGRALLWLGKMVWLGRHPEPEPRSWTSQERQEAWDKGEIPPPEFPDTRFGRFDRRFTQFTKWWSYLAGLGLLSIVVVLVVDVVGWKLFKHPFPTATDFVKYMNVVAVFFAVAFIQTDRGSVAIELLQKRLPLRAKAVLRTFAWLAGMAVCFYCAYTGCRLVARHLEHLTRSDPPLSFLIWPFSMVMVVGFILLGVSFVVSGVRDLVECRERRARYGGQGKRSEMADRHPPMS